MPDEVILDVTTIEENVTVETTAGDVVGIQVVAPTGPAGATGPAGPNSVTSATTSDGTGQIMLDTLAVGICNILDEVVFDTLTYTFAEGSAQALKDALDISFADISDAQTGTANLTLNNVSTVSFTAGNSSTTSGEITIFTNGPVFQWRSDTVEYGERGFTFLTTDITSEVNYTLPNSSGTIALTGNTSGEPDKLTAGTISGATTFNTTSYTYGTGAAAAHRTALGVVEANPSTAYIVDDFAGNTTVSPTIGDLGWFSFASGGGSGSLIAAPATTSPNIGVRVLTCGNATNAAQVVYLNNWTNLFSYNWESCFVIAASQTTDCDIICGFTKDTAALGVGKFGGISIGVRYSSATDTNWMLYSKNTNTTFAANDANNYSVSSGVAASTAYNTFRIRCASGTVEMSVNGGAWTSVTTSGITLTGAWIPYFYVSTRTTANKSGSIDYFSFKSTNLSR